ncbi:MAG: ferredoxin [Planctomycetes bacterium]|nr:ferredoxin [Planctomycetota bacterium]
MPEDTQGIPRREFLRVSARGVALAAVVGGTGYLATRSREARYVWQLDPSKCTQCGKCATNCVLKPSAVKCVHAFAMCGYCELCTGYFEPEPNALTTAAENQLCPVAAIKRTFVEDPYFEYEIDEPLCIGCGKCVEGCRAFGNGSLFLQVRHDRCLNCNECSIAAACPAEAFSRVPATQGYLYRPGYSPATGKQG